MTKKKAVASKKRGVSNRQTPVREKKQEKTPVDTAVRKIKEMMYHHEIIPGQKLLYQELSKKLDMSITPIIQALNRLQLLNIVYSKRNRGFYVGETDPVEARELFVAREAFETFLVPTIIKNLTDAKLSLLEKAIKKHVEAASIPEYRRSLMLKDTTFHLQMIEIAGNKVIYNLCKMTFEQIYLKYRPEYMRDERIKEATEEHWAIFQTLKDRDVRKARSLIKQHINNGKEFVSGSLRREERTSLDF